MSSSFGNILIPSGGSLHKSAISLATPLITCGDKFSTFETYSNRDYKWTLFNYWKRILLLFSVLFQGFQSLIKLKGWRKLPELGRS
jgi:hypothetical protein